MAVIFGEGPDKAGWIKVTVIQYQIEEHENGYSVDAGCIPSYPDAGMGVGWVQFYHPKKDEWKFEKTKIPYTEAEGMLEVAAAIRELAQAIKEK
jgi:hypothetical protein